MVKSIIDLSERESRIINIVKAKYGLKDKSQALSIILKRYEECELEPELRPEFITEIEQARKNGKFVKVKDFAKEFEIK
ncbi:DUF2683 family protein [Candidatus Bathyarchaeota archaeon]|nr:DUF2683 family protein [Candidatus Bathyarchaeota archaeon]